MAYQIFWRIPFQALNSATLYTINIYKDGELPSGYPLTLTGASDPFSTEETRSDDVFKSLRTQSGYIRIFDDGTAVNMSRQTVTFDWKDLIPTNDTDRPVTLTHMEGNTTVIDWQGFMQAQNFGGDLYGNPQNREFPIQCPLSTLSRMDIDPEAYDGTKNFAALLDYVLDSIPYITFTQILIQTGAADARTWLLTKFDWSLFGEENDEGELEGKHDILKAVEGLCRYWGWEMRTSGTAIHLNRVDDTLAGNFLVLTRADLATLATGTSAGIIDSDGYIKQSIGDIFANTNNTEYYLRGYNKAAVSADGGEIDAKLLYAYPMNILKWMFDSGFTSAGGNIEYSNNASEFDTDLIHGSGPTGSLCLKREFQNVTAVVRLTSAMNAVRFYTKRLHNYIDGYFEIKGRHNDGGNAKNIVLQLSVGKMNPLLNEAMYWNGTEWTYASSATFTASIGGGSGSGMKIFTNGLAISEGYVTLRLLLADGQAAFDMEGFEVSFTKKDNFMPYVDTKNTHEYKAKNGTMVRNEWSDDTIFATDNYNVFGAGVVLNPDKSLFSGWNYSTHSAGTTKPEQHLANRVAAFTDVSRRVVRCELRNELLPFITPHYKLTMDGMTFYPYSISREWRDDILRIEMINV